MERLKAGDLFYSKKVNNAICMNSFEIKVKLCQVEAFKKYCVLKVYKKESMIMFIEIDEIKESYYLLKKDKLYLMNSEIPSFKIIDRIPLREVKEVLKLINIDALL